jgi:ribosomal-protein-serine acetyltransferase
VRNTAPITGNESAGELAGAGAQQPTFHLANGRHLRPLDESDAAELYELVERNRARLAQWMAWAAEQTPDQTLRFIHSQIAQNDGLTAALVADDRIVGVVGFHGIDWPNRSASIGYWLSEDEQGRGTMTEAVRALVEHAFTHWRLNRVEIRADIENLRSRAVPERLGFHQEGVLRQAYRVSDDRYSDDAVYSMLASEWREHGERSV